MTQKEQDTNIGSEEVEKSAEPVPLVLEFLRGDPLDFTDVPNPVQIFSK